MPDANDALTEANAKMAWVVNGNRERKKNGKHRPKMLTKFVIEAFLPVIDNMLGVSEGDDIDPTLLLKQLLLLLECAQFYLEEAAYHLGNEDEAPALGPSDLPDGVEPLAGSVKVVVTHETEGVIANGSFDSMILSLPFSIGPAAIFSGREDRWPALLAGLLETAKRGGTLAQAVSIFKDGMKLHTVHAKNIEFDGD